MAKRQEEIENSIDFQQLIKGIIAVMVTTLIVIIIVMLFAKSLFNPSSAATSVKTGHLTTVEYEYVEPTPNNDEEVKATTAGEKDEEDEEEEETEAPATDLPEGLDLTVAGQYTVTNAVYLHPEPSSSSANLMVLPAGATVTVYGSANYGWYYLEYDGQYGYAWSSGYLAAAG